MDDYIEPKDSKKFQWGVLRSPLSTNQYSDEEDEDDGYSQPYRPGPVPDPDDIYEIAPGQPMKTNSTPDYDVPPCKPSVGTNHASPSPHKPKTSSESPGPLSDADGYCHLKYNGTSAAEAVQRRSTSGDGDFDDGEDSYSHTASWMAQKAERQNSNTSDPPSSPSKAVPGIPKTTKNASRQNSNGSLSGTSPVLKNSASKSPTTDDVRTFTRQRVIYPRKSTSSGVVMDLETCSQQSSGPAVYEEAWDSVQQQKRLEENLRLARSISACSDTFEDALEYLPEDWAPTRSKSGNRKSDHSLTGGKTTDPVTGGEYEPAWDLNRGLEEKLRSLQMTHSSPETGGKEGGDCNYQEPWDLAQKQRELEEKIKIARAGAVRGSPHSPQHPPQPLHHHQQAPSGQQRRGEELYEAPWDTKKGLAHMLQTSPGVEGHGSSPRLSGSHAFSRSSQSVTGAIGEPINAMIPLNNQEWYHGNISRDDAERMLRVCKDGSYLVRDSSDRCHYTLSIKSAIQTIHIQIDQCQKANGNMRYILGKNSKAFPTIPSMIDHYTHHVVPIKGAEHMTLLYPVHCKYSGGEESLA